MTEHSSFLVGIDKKYYNTLDMESFALMMKNPSCCYKFYWLEAIVKLISEGVTQTNFNTIIDEMIANAWYCVREFHVHLSSYQRGEVRDGLERAILKLASLCDLPSNTSKIEIKNALAFYAKPMFPYKEQLTRHVPYRALAGFFRRTSLPINWKSSAFLVEYIQTLDSEITLPYTLGSSSKLNREVYFHPDWIEMIQDNTVSILGWIQFEKVKWLQTNNPDVPALMYKLAPLDTKTRKLNKVRRLWDSVLALHPVQDMYTEKNIKSNYYDIDHFIPWSFVMNDELWNLTPMDSSLNSSKSNYLPQWSPFFDRFAQNQYILYSLIHSSSRIHHLYDDCFHDNLHSIWAAQELYCAGNTEEQFKNILQQNMQPVYHSARRQGYAVWNYD